IGTGTTTNTLENCVLANNGAFNFQISGTGASLVDAGHNLDSVGDSGWTNGTNGDVVGSNPLLSTLGLYNASFGTSLALLPGGPAIDAGMASGAPATDARGISRVGTVDIGAYESQGFTLSLVGGSSQTTTVNSGFGSPLTVGVAALVLGEPVNGGKVKL